MLSTTNQSKLQAGFSRESYHKHETNCPDRHAAIRRPKVLDKIQDGADVLQDVVCQCRQVGHALSYPSYSDLAICIVLGSGPLGGLPEAFKVFAALDIQGVLLCDKFASIDDFVPELPLPGVAFLESLPF